MNKKQILDVRKKNIKVQNNHLATADIILTIVGILAAWVLANIHGQRFPSEAALNTTSQGTRYILLYLVGGWIVSIVITLKLKWWPKGLPILLVVINSFVLLFAVVVYGFSWSQFSNWNLSF